VIHKSSKRVLPGFKWAARGKVPKHDENTQKLGPTALISLLPPAEFPHARGAVPTSPHPTQQAFGNRLGGTLIEENSHVWSPTQKPTRWNNMERWEYALHPIPVRGLTVINNLRRGVKKKQRKLLE